MYAMPCKDNTGAVTVTPAAIAKAATEIVAALKGVYLPAGGQHPMPVNGDLSKALYSPKVGALARSLLFPVSNITRDLDGTQELRRRARSITNAIRIAFGLPSV